MCRRHVRLNAHSDGGKGFVDRIVVAAVTVNIHMYILCIFGLVADPIGDIGGRLEYGKMPR